MDSIRGLLIILLFVAVTARAQTFYPAPTYSYCYGGIPFFNDACVVAECPKHTGASCNSNYNGCVARFHDQFVNEVTNDCHCGVGKLISKCIIDPCKTATCPGQRHVECRTNRCGGCKAIFYDRFGNIAACKSTDPDCPDDYRVCKADACDTSTCSRHQKAKCTSKCNACVAQFSDKWGRDFTKQCPCPGRIFEMICNEDICKGKTCRAYPKAECRVNGCGGCHMEFFDQSGNKLTCEESVCSLDPDAGPCEALITRYYHDTKTGRCQKFIYGGCKGNDNNFKSLEACRKRCPDTCMLPMEIGPCKAAIRRYFFNKATWKCERFIYGGCKGNSNNFKTLKDCQDRCPADPDCPDDRVCKADACDVSTCSRHQKAKCTSKCNACVAQFFNKWDRDITKQCRCPGRIFEAFCKEDICKGKTCRGYPKAECRVNGCGGCHVEFFDQNGNKLTCKELVCSLKKDSGPCDGAFTRYYFNSESGRCETFVYGGCEGNDNNFKTLSQCQRTCKETELCSLDADAGPCEAAITRYFHDTNTGTCQKFIYGGCKGNDNNFKSLEACRKRCPDTCNLPMDIGPCKAAIARYFFNKATWKCERFSYGGCKGNSNNFKTFKDCQDRCPAGQVCPAVSPGVVGICVDQCKGDKMCPGDKKCCSNGCGRVCTESFYTDCADGTPIYCLVPACQFASCPAQIGSRCRGMCNNCNSHFFDKFGNEVTDQCRCRRGVLPVKCLVDPCKGATCVGHTNVECRSNYCGQCKAIFYGPDGKEVACKKPTNPRCPKFSPDLITTCDVRCFGDDSCKNGQICCPYGCSIRCTNPALDTRCPPPDPKIIASLPFILCPASGCKSNRECKRNDICCFNGCSNQCRKIPSYDPRCPAIVGKRTGTCPHHCTANEECRSDYMCCLTKCGSECQPKKNPCEGVVIALCVPGGPCKYASCANHPKATCRATCASCVAEFYDENNLLIKDCLSGPPPPPFDI